MSELREEIETVIRDCVYPGVPDGDLEGVGDAAHRILAIPRIAEALAKSRPSGIRLRIPADYIGPVPEVSFTPDMNDGDVLELRDGKWQEPLAANPPERPVRKLSLGHSIGTGTRRD